VSPAASGPQRRFWQLVAVVCLALLLSMPFHKGYHDVSLLAEKHSGTEFWFALVTYFIGNLAGGGKS